jgi:hypothetical protein
LNDRAASTRSGSRRNCGLHQIWNAALNPAAIASRSFALSEQW